MTTSPSNTRPAINIFLFDPFLNRFEQWVRDKLPVLNSRIEDGVVPLSDLIADFLPHLHELQDRIFPHVEYMTHLEIQRLLQLLGFVASSVEKHSQDCSLAPGIGLAKLPEVEDMLVQLGRMAGHPPRDSHYTYWKWNRAETPLTFTGNPQEMFFNRVVNRTDDLHSASCNALRPICEGHVVITSPEAIEAILLAAHNMNLLHADFLSFMTRGDNGQRNMEPQFFMKRMRTYLPTYPIQEVIWGGVNAANLASQMQVDYLIGTVNGPYAEVVRGRWRYLTEEDQNALAYDMVLPSVGTLLLQQLHLQPDQVLKTDLGELTAYVKGQPVEVQQVLSAYRKLIMASARLTAMHWTLIQNYLIKPAASLSDEDLANMVVRPDKGTGGMDHEDTKAIMRMRREHQVIGKLIETAL